MLRKEDFVFCIGYQGDTALVDKRAKKKYGRMSTSELLQTGLLRAAFSSAVYDDSEEDMKKVISSFNDLTGSKLKTSEEMKRLLGIFAVPEEIHKVLSL